MRARHTLNSGITVLSVSFRPTRSAPSGMRDAKLQQRSGGGSSGGRQWWTLRQSGSRKEQRTGALDSFNKLPTKSPPSSLWQDTKEVATGFVHRRLLAGFKHPGNAAYRLPSWRVGAIPIHLQANHCHKNQSDIHGRTQACLSTGFPLQVHWLCVAGCAHLLAAEDGPYTLGNVPGHFVGDPAGARRRRCRGQQCKGCWLVQRETAGPSPWQRQHPP